MTTTVNPEGDAKRETNSPSFSQQNLIKQAIPTALEILLIAIDQCNTLFDSLASTPIGRRSLATQQYRQYLSAREQKEMDEAIESFRSDFKGQAEREVETLRATVGEVPDAYYPFAEEMEAAAAGAILEKVWQQEAHKHFDKYRDDQIKLGYIATRARLGPAGQIESTLGSAMVPLIVGKMESFLGALIRTGITLHPNALGDLPSIPPDIYQAYKDNISSADIHRWQIDQKVTAFIKGSPDEWEKTISRWAKIDITSVGADWDALIEMIQRRHAIVHNSGYVDANYMRNVASSLRHGLQLGSSLVSDRAYISPALIELETWAMCLASRWAKHFFKQKGIYYPLNLDRVMRLEDLGRWTQALAILDALLAEPLPSESDLVIMARVNRWFCLQELGKDNSALRREIITTKLGATDQSVNREKLAVLGRYALLRKYDELLKTIRDVTEGPHPNMQKRDLRAMPLIKRAMRESSRIRAFLLSSGRAAQGPPHQGRVRRKSSA